MKTFFNAIIVIGMLLGLPLLGAVLAGRDIKQYTEFPPLTHYVEPAPFSWPVFVFLSAVILLTVVPFIAAVYGVCEMLGTFPRLSAGLDKWVALRVPWPRLAAWTGLSLSAAGLAGISIWPDYLFPLLWVAPLLIILCIQVLRGRATILAPLAHGNWETVYRWALAALICGFFWEMWNMGSYARWIYTVPFVNRFQIFEMPLPGYAGYLPFGLQCAVAALAIESWFSHHRRQQHKTAGCAIRPDVEPPSQKTLRRENVD